MAAFAVILVLGTALLFINIAGDSLWYDESYTAALVTQPFQDIVSISGGDSHPPLYYLMLKPVYLIFGNSETALRAFSVLGVLALAALGIGPVRRAAGIRVGMLYALLVFLMPIAISMAHEARMYTWAAFFVTGSALYGFLAQRDAKRKDWALFVLFSIAAAYTHYYALLAVGMIFIIMLIFCVGEKKKRIPFFISAAVTAAAYLPWVVVLAGQVNRVTGSFWIPALTPDIILSVFVYPFSHKFPDTSRLGIAVPLFALACGWILFGIIYKGIKKDANVKLSVLAVGAYLLTILAGIAASFVIRPVLVERYMVPVLGLFVLGLAYGLAAVKKRVLFVIAVCATAAACVPQIYFNMTTRVNGAMYEAKAALSAELQDGDVFLHTDEHTFGTFSYYFPGYKQYYYQRKGYEGYSNYDAFLPNGVTIDSLDEIEGNPRIWLVQRKSASDTFSAAKWTSTGALITKETMKTYFVPTSWYSVSVSRVEKGSETKKQAVPPGSGKLMINIDGLKNSKGSVIVLLYGAMSDEPEKSAAGNIKYGQSAVAFSDLPYGEYSVMAYHDENANGSLDMNGNTAAEGYGYANSVGSPSAASDFGAYRFTFGTPTAIRHILIHY